jgi:hypothetical protein
MIQTMTLIEKLPSKNDIRLPMPLPQQHYGKGSKGKAEPATAAAGVGKVHTIEIRG